MRIGNQQARKPRPAPPKPAPIDVRVQQTAPAPQEFSPIVYGQDSRTTARVSPSFRDQSDALILSVMGMVFVFLGLAGCALFGFCAVNAAVEYLSEPMAVFGFLAYVGATIASGILACVAGILYATARR